MRRDFVSRLAVAPLQAAFAPLSVASAAAMGVRQLRVSRQLGVSQTAVEVLNARCAMHLFDLREDDAALRLAHALPNASPISLGVALFPLWMTHQVDREHASYPRRAPQGGERLTDLITARTFILDELIDDATESAEQFVFLGAGFDTRAYGSLARKELTIFELDQTKTQTLKRTALEQAHIDSEHVRYVSIDFRRDRIGDRLERAGFDPSKQTVFLWEGVSLYLDEESVSKTLKDLSQLAAPGSVILADFYAQRLLRFGRHGPARRLLALTGESFQFGLPMVDTRKELEALLAPTGLTVGKLSELGADTRLGSFAAVVEIVA